jgi:tetratricopeptide (TPR) repeat protein
MTRVTYNRETHQFQRIAEKIMIEPLSLVKKAEKLCSFDKTTNYMCRKLTLIIFWFVIAPSSMWAMNEDSLIKVCTRPGKIELKAYDKLLGYYAKNTPDDLYAWSKKLLERALKQEDEFAEMLAYSYLGDYYSERGNHNLGLTNIHRSRTFYETTNAGKELVNVYNGIGNIYFRKGEFTEAVKWYLKSMAKGDELQDVWMMNMAKLNLGRCYIELKEEQKGESAILDFIEQVRRLDQPTSLANAYNVLGGYYQGKGDYDLADHYFNEALVIGMNNGDKRNMAHSYNNLAISYFFQDKKELSKAYFRKALTQRIEMDIKMYVAESYYNLGDWFFFQNQYDSALHYYRLSYQTGKEGDSYSAMGDALWAMAEVEKSRKRFEQAVGYLTEYFEVKESQFRNNSREDLAVLEFDYAMAEEKRNRDARKQEELTEAQFTAFETRNKWLVISGISTLLVCILILIIKLWSDKKRYESGLAELSTDFSNLHELRSSEKEELVQKSSRLAKFLLNELPDVAHGEQLKILGNPDLIRTRLIGLPDGSQFVWDAPLELLDSAVFTRQLYNGFQSQVDADRIEEAIEKQEVIDSSLVEWIWINQEGAILAKSGFETFRAGLRKSVPANELSSGILVHQQFPVACNHDLMELEKRLLELNGFSEQMWNALVQDVFKGDEALQRNIILFYSE